MNNAQLDVLIKLNDQFSGKLSAINSQLETLTKKTDKLNGMGKAANSKGGFFKQFLGANLASGAITGAVGMITGAISTIGSSIIDSAANSESYLTKLTGMLGGNAVAAKEHADMLRKFAATSPFNLKELQAADTQMLAYGYSIDEIGKKMSLLGDISAGSKSSIGANITTLGQIKTKGKADAVDMREFANRGIPIFDALAKTMGTSSTNVQDMVSRGQIGEKEVSAALESLTTGTGIFTNAMKNQSKTFEGQLSNLTDNLYNMAAKIGEGILPVLTKGIGFVNSFMAKIPESAIKGLGDAIGRLFDKVMGVFNYLESNGVFENVATIFGDLYSIIETVVFPAFDALGPALKLITNNIKETVGALRVFIDSLKPVTSEIGYQFAVLFEQLNVLMRGLTVAFYKTLNAVSFKAFAGQEASAIKKYNEAVNQEFITRMKLTKLLEKEKKEEEKKGTTTATSVTPTTQKTPVKSPSVQGLTSTAPKVININILSGEGASLIDNMSVSNIYDSSTKDITQDMKNKLQAYLLELLNQASLVPVAG
jgi:tape measure domain-containing protein